MKISTLFLIIILLIGVASKIHSGMTGSELTDPDWQTSWISRKEVTRLHRYHGVLVSEIRGGVMYITRNGRDIRVADIRGYRNPK